jgi:hypothetical protein
MGKFTGNRVGYAFTGGARYEGGVFDITSQFALNKTKDWNNSFLLPILNTTNRAGQTITSGVRGDDSADSLILAIPGGTASGISTSDVSPATRTSTIKTVSNTGVVNSTSYSKYYGGSMYLDGGSGPTTNAFLSISNVADFIPTSRSFTIEAWVYTTDYTNTNWIFFTGNNAASTINYLYISSTGIPNFRFGTAVSGGSVSLNTWTHIAAVRNLEDTTTKLFLNGRLAASANSASSPETNTATCYVGAYYDSNWGASNPRSPFKGYINDLRVYNIAKYTKDFII